MITKALKQFSPVQPLNIDGVTQHYFDVKKEVPYNQLLAWRDRMGTILDFLPAKSQMEQPFEVWANRYTVGQLSIVDAFSDSVRVERSLARISSTRNCNYFLISICVDGDSPVMEGRYKKSKNPTQMKILILDLDQPILMQAFRHRFTTIFVPRDLMNSIFPDADVLHGRSLSSDMPFTKLLIRHISAFNQKIPSMTKHEFDNALRLVIQNLVYAFGKNALLNGNARAAARALMYGQVRNFIKDNLDDSELTAEKILGALHLPRDTLYRMCENDGGIATLICDYRLRAAAEEIAKYPHLALKDVAYGVGFNSASAFSRACRRVYEVSPQDLKDQILAYAKT